MAWVSCVCVFPEEYFPDYTALQWRHNDHDGVSNHQPHIGLLNRLFRRRSKKTSKLCVTGLCVGNSPGPVNSPQRASYAENRGRIQDLKLGVALMRGGGCYWKNIVYICFKYDYAITYMSNTILFNRFLLQWYLLSPLIQYYNKKNLIWKNFRGGARPVRPLLTRPWKMFPFDDVIMVEGDYAYFPTSCGSLDEDAITAAKYFPATEHARGGGY